MRREFAIQQQDPYVDNAVTTSLSDQVMDAMLPYLQESYGDPDEPYGLGEDAREALDGFREEIAESVEAEHLWFTSGGTEANNWVIAKAGLDGRVPICSAVEHLSVIRSVQRAGGYIIPVDENGQVEMASLQGNVESGDVGLVSVQYANQETGVIQELDSIASLCVANSVPLHVDAAMAFGVDHFDMADRGIDFLTVSGHKVWGPVGVGALLSNGKYPIKPLMLGGNQEEGMRPGPVNMPAVAGFAEAMKILRSQRLVWQKVAKLRDGFEMSLGELKNVRVNGVESTRLPNMSSVTIIGSDASFLAAEMERSHSLCVGIGGAAEKGTSSRVLREMGVSGEDREASIRLRLPYDATKQQIELLVISICSAMREENGRPIM